jgi:hypothetical protein
LSLPYWSWYFKRLFLNRITKTPSW